MKEEDDKKDQEEETDGKKLRGRWGRTWCQKESPSPSSSQLFSLMQTVVVYERFGCGFNSLQMLSVWCPLRVEILPPG